MSVLISTLKENVTGKQVEYWDFPGGLGAKTMLPMQGAQVCFLVGNQIPYATVKGPHAATKIEGLATKTQSNQIN